MKCGWDKKGLVLVILLTAFCLGSCGTSPDSPYKYWLGGKTVDVDGTVSDFPAIFPELYLKNGWDGETLLYMPKTKTLSTGSGSQPYCRMHVQVEEGAASYDDAAVEYFMMIGGAPGNMEVWGVTFGMPFEEADRMVRSRTENWTPPVNIRALEVKELEDADSSPGCGYTLMQGLREAGVPEEELELVDYQLGKMSFTVAYRNGEVYGMLIYRYR